MRSFAFTVKFYGVKINANSVDQTIAVIPNEVRNL